jgi:hypothetical protein
MQRTAGPVLEPRLPNAAMSASVGYSWWRQKRDKINFGFAKGLWHKSFQRFRHLSGHCQKRLFLADRFWHGVIGRKQDRAGSLSVCRLSIRQFP